MGQRANFAIGNSLGYELFYSHWCANTLTSDLFWGSEHALRFVRQQRPVDAENGWLDTVWAEGGAVIDPSNKLFMLYGGESLLFDVPLRRLFLKLLRVAWQGWTIRWASEGIVEIAEYPGVERGRVIADSNASDRALDLAPPKERDWLNCVGTFQTEGS